MFGGPRKLHESWPEANIAGAKKPPEGGQVGGRPQVVTSRKGCLRPGRVHRNRGLDLRGELGTL